MFTGIIEETGILREIRKNTASMVLTIQGKEIFKDLRLGDSVAVNGVCLTVTDLLSDAFRADVMHETLNRSCLKNIFPGTLVNLERAMPANGRFGGHMVSGHVDGIGIIKAIRKDDNALWYTIEAPEPVLYYIVEKGSIAVDGISLTVASVTKREFCLSAIPHTVKSTTLSRKKAGDQVNLENDFMGKYIEKFFLISESKDKEKRITKEFLTKFGY